MQRNVSFSPHSRLTAARAVTALAIRVRRVRRAVRLMAPPPPPLFYLQPNLNHTQGLRRPGIRDIGGYLQPGHFDMGYVRARGAGQSALRPVRGGMQAQRRPETPVAAAASTRSPPGYREIGGAMLEIGASRSSDGPCGRSRASRNCRFRRLGSSGLAPLFVGGCV